MGTACFSTNFSFFPLRPNQNLPAVDLSKAGLPAALFGGLARHPLGGLKDSACPPEFTRHSCGGFVWRVNPV